MKIIEILQKLAREKKKAFSFEFFPPKTDQGFVSLYETIARLKPLNPTYVSVTYGAGGSTRQKTIDLAARMKHQMGIEAMAHLTCLGHTKEELLEILKKIESLGIENVLALRGDPPQGQDQFVPVEGGFSHASELVEFIRSYGFSFCLAVAGYPEGHQECKDKDQDLRYLKQKVDMGADFVITQLFFENLDYFDFVERARDLGISCPIIPGIMPIVNFHQIQRFTRLCGATIPADLLEKLEAVQDDPEKVKEIGIQHATEQCLGLLEGGAPGIHFYTLNKSDATLRIYKSLQKAGSVRS